MTAPNLTDKQADVALDPMAGTLANLRSIESSADLESSPGGLFSPTSEVRKINVTILALDLGNLTGYALRRRDGSIRHGTWDFRPQKNWTPGQRWARFRAQMARVVVDEQVSTIAFERVVFGHSSSGAADVYGGFKALVELIADAHNLQLTSVAVPTVKRHWTGNGRADKDAMLGQAKVRGFIPDSHNAADALAVLDWAAAQERAALAS